jgi:hypothetical protein
LGVASLRLSVTLPPKGGSAVGGGVVGRYAEHHGVLKAMRHNDETSLFIISSKTQRTYKFNSEIKLRKRPSMSEETKTVVWQLGDHLRNFNSVKYLQD